MAKNNFLNQNVKTALRHLIVNLNYPKYYADYICDEIEDYPYCDTLDAFSYALEKYGIENSGVSSSINILEEKAIFPVIAYLNYNKASFVIIKKIDSTGVWIASGKKDICVDRIFFDRIFTGYCIILDVNSKLKISRKDFLKWFLVHHSKWVGLGASALLISSRLYFSNNLWEVVFVLIYGIGFFICLLIFKEEIGIKSQLSSLLCNNKVEQISCKSILHSEASSFLGILSWSDIGIAYFSTLFLSVMLLGFNLVYSSLVVFSFITFPYTFYSVFFQWKIANIWCPLCLIVQALFIIQLILSIILLPIFDFNIIICIMIILLGVTILSIWLTIKPVIINSKKYPDVRKKFNLLKQKILQRDLFATNIMINNLEGVNQIYYNNECENTITFVFSPLCVPCVNMINSLLNIISNYNLNLRIIFIAKEYRLNDEIPIIAFFIEKFLEAPNKLLIALKQYANNFSILNLKWKKHKTNIIYKKQIESIINVHKKWYNVCGFVGTPVILFNNMQIPPLYTIDDLEYFIHTNHNT